MSEELRKLWEEIAYTKGLIEGSEVQNRTLHIVIERLLRERQDTVWDKDVRGFVSAHVALIPMLPNGLNVDKIPEMAMKWADEIQKGREERAKLGTKDLSE